MSPSSRRAAVALGLAALTVGVVFLASRPAPPPAPVTSGTREPARPETKSPRLATGAPREPRADPAAKEPPASAPTPARLTGHVTSETGAPVVGARVGVTLERGEVVEEIATARTRAPDGAYEADLARLGAHSRLERAVGRLLVRASAAGFRLDGPGVGLPAAADPRPVDLVLKPGIAVRGRVVAEDGNPVPGAALTFSFDGVPENTLWADGQGRYEFGVRGPGEGRLTATGSSVGAGTATFTIGGPADVEVPDLVLHGAGAIEGTARYKDGSPVARLRVQAHADDGLLWSGPYDVASEDPAAGLKRTTTRTDVGGRFRLAGLRPGRYVVFAEVASQVSAATGDTDVRLTVESRRLVVVVRDAEGHVLPGALHSAHWKSESEEEMSAGVLLDPDGRVDFWGAPGTTIRVSAHAEGVPPAEAAVTLDAQRNEMETTLVLGGEKRPEGRLKLLVLDDVGNAPAHSVVEAETEIGGTLVLYEEEPDARGLLPPVPAGRYRLKVNPGRGARQAPLEMFLPIETTVEVRANEETTVSLRARPCGRIRARVHVGADHAFPSWVSLIAHPRAGGKSVPMGAFVGVDPRGWTLGDLTAEKPGVLFTPLEPGPYEVVVTAEGFRPERVQVSIDPGRIADLDVTLEPQDPAGK